MTARDTDLPNNILLPKSLSSHTREERLAAAKSWVKTAEQAGLRPLMVQRSLVSEDAGEWHLSYAAHGGSFDRLFPF